MNQEDQLAMIQRAVAGDGDALAQLLDGSRKYLHVCLSEKIPADLRSVVAVDDLIQETNLEAIRHIHTFQPNHADAFLKWLGTIAARKLHDEIKKQGAAKRGAGRVRRIGSADSDESLLQLAELVRSSEPSASRSVSRREALAAMHSALDALPRDYREAVWLVYVERQAVSTAAQEMGRSERAVHGLCRRGLQQLREILGDPSQYLTRPG